MAAALVIPIAEFSLGVLQKIVDGIVGVDRKIAIGFKNYSKHTLQSVGVYFNSGSSDQNIARLIHTQEAGLFSARKSDHTARGTVGVYSYYIEDVNKTVHVMWSVPFDYNLYSNWWNVAVDDGRVEASEAVYDGMYNGTGGYPYPNKPDQWIDRTSNGFHLLGSMTNNGQALLEVELKNIG